MATKKPALTDDVLHVGYCLDMSGSMRAAWSNTKEAVETYVNDLKKEEAKIRRKFGKGNYTHYTLTGFSNSSYLMIETTPISEIDVHAALLGRTPSGGTALWDSILDTIRNIESVAQEGEKVLIAIFTDGGENASRKIRHGELKTLIEAKEEEGWVFTWLGADMPKQQVVATASALGVPVGNVAFFAKTTDSYSMMNEGMSTATSMLRSAKGASAAAASTNLYSSAGVDNDFGSEEEPNTT